MPENLEESPMAAEMLKKEVLKNTSFLGPSQKHALSGINRQNCQKRVQKRVHENDHPWMPWIQELTSLTFCDHLDPIFVNTGTWD